MSSQGTAIAGASRLAAPETISKPSRSASGKVTSLFSSRRTKSIANSESYGSLLGTDEASPPVPELPSNYATLSGRDRQPSLTGSGRIQGPRMRIPSGPALKSAGDDRVISDDSRNGGHTSQTLLPSQVGLGVDFGDGQSLLSASDIFDSLRPAKQSEPGVRAAYDGVETTSALASAGPLPGTPPRTKQFSASGASSSPSSPYSTMRSHSRYSAKIQADLEALKATETRRQRPGSEDLLGNVSAAPGQGLDKQPLANKARIRDKDDIDFPSKLAVVIPDKNASPPASVKNGSRKPQLDSFKRETRISNGSNKHSPSPGELYPAQNILRQLGSTRDFSHLPPSPSSASIGQFMMRESTSATSFSPTVTPNDKVGDSPSRSTFGYPFPSPRQDGKQFSQVSGLNTTARRNKEHSPATTTERDTAEALRKLDGLSKASSSSLRARAKLSTDPSILDFGQGDVLAQPTSRGVNAEDRESQRKEKDSSSASSSPATSKSRGTSFTSTLPSTGPSGNLSPTQKSPDGAKRASIGSSSGVEGSHAYPDARALVPPVPPLPGDYQPRSTGLVKSSTVGNLSTIIVEDSVPDIGYVPPMTSSAQSAARSLPSSVSSPLLPSSTSPKLPDMKSPNIPISSAFENAPAGADRPRRMSKKWSFSSALSLGSGNAKHRSDAGLGSAGTTDKATPSDFTSPTLQIPDWSDRSPNQDLTSGTGQSSLPGSIGNDSALSGESDPKPPVNNRRSTSSGIPFFRRSSSSSSSTAGVVASWKHSSSAAGKDFAPTSIPSQPSASLNSNRKTLLGVGMSLLKGSSSRRNLRRQPSSEQINTVDAGSLPVSRHGRKPSLGWTARRKGSVSCGSPAHILYHSDISRHVGFRTRLKMLLKYRKAASKSVIRATPRSGPLLTHHSCRKMDKETSLIVL